jgi:REase_DpnII-MboI
MPKKASETPVIRRKTFTSADDVSQAIVKLRARIHQVEELKKDGLPYRDALKVTAEYQIRDTLREIFGEHSPESLEHQNLKIKISTKAGVNETIGLLQHLVVGLEENRLEILGLRARPPEDIAAAEPPRHDNVHKRQEEQSPASTQPPPPPPTAAHSPAEVEAKPNMPEAPPPLPEVEPVQATAPILVAVDSPPAPKKLKLSAEVPLRRQDTPPDESAQAAPSQDRHTSAEVSMPTNIQAGGAPIGASNESANPDALRRRPELNGQSETDTDGMTHALETLRKTCGAFHRVARHLRHRRDERPTLEVEDERDVLDLLHALLAIDYEHIDTEDWTPSYQEGAIQTDLWLKAQGVVVLAKKTKPGLNAKGLTHQISVDIERYASHVDCKLVFCFIYDPEGRIGKPRALESELTVNGGGHRVEAFVSPK